METSPESLKDEFDVLLEVVARLHGRGLAYMLTGSMAMSFYATPRMTRDLDFVLELEVTQLAQFISEFQKDFYLSPDAILEAIRGTRMFNIVHFKTVIKVDLILRKDSEYRRQEFGRRQKVKFKEVEVWIVSKEDLILSKLDWAKDSESTKQLEDVRNLLVSGCDLSYIEPWVQKLDLQEIWSLV